MSMNHDYEIGVALSDSVDKTNVKRSLAEMTLYPVGIKTSLSRKPCIPEKSYHGTLSGSHGRSFRIRHEKSPEAPSGG